MYYSKKTGIMIMIKNKYYRESKIRSLDFKGETSNFLTTGCSKNAAAFKNDILLCKIGAACCRIWRLQLRNSDIDQCETHAKSPPPLFFFLFFF